MNLNREITNLLIIYIIGIIYWLTLVFWREYNGKDVLFLRKDLFYKCNGWCISHLIHYIVLAYVAPSYWLPLIVIGFLFEVAESYLNKASSFIDCKLVEDTITNTIGVIIGLIFFNFFPNKIDILKMKLT